MERDTQRHSTTHKIDTPLNIEFLKAVAKEGSHQKTPKYYTDRSWARARNMLGLYWGTKLTLDEVGHMQSVSKSHAGMLVSRARRRLHSGSSISIRAQFPLKQLEKERKIIKRTSTKDLIVSAGIHHEPNTAAIAQKVKRSIHTAYIAVKKLKKEGYDIQIGTAKTPQAELKIKLRRAKTQREIQSVLDLITKRGYELAAKDPNGPIVPLARFLREITMSVNSRFYPQILQTLKNAHVPVGIIEIEVKNGAQKGVLQYHFLAAKSRRNAARVLTGSRLLSGLFTPPVKQICGQPEAESPSTFTLKDSSRYKSVQRHMRELGINLGTKAHEILTPENLTQCPVPIFVYKTKSHRDIKFRREDEQRLSKYILSELHQAIQTHT